MDREAWHAAIHGVAKSRTWLSDWTELNWTEPSSELWPAEFHGLYSDGVAKSWTGLRNFHFHFWLQSLGCKDPLEKEMTTHSSVFAWKIPWMEEPGRLQSMGSQRIGHDWATNTCTCKHLHKPWMESESLVSPPRMETSSLCSSQENHLTSMNLHDPIWKRDM